MRSPNLAFNMFSKQPFSIYGQVFNPDFIHLLVYLNLLKLTLQNLICFVSITQFYPEQPYFF